MIEYPINLELVRQVRDTILLHPEMHDQAMYVTVDDDGRNLCNTTCCVAGWACFLTGKAVFVRNHLDDVWWKGVVIDEEFAAEDAWPEVATREMGLQRWIHHDSDGTPDSWPVIPIYSADRVRNLPLFSPVLTERSQVLDALDHIIKVGEEESGV